MHMGLFQFEYRVAYIYRLGIIQITVSHPLCFYCCCHYLHRCLIACRKKTTRTPHRWRHRRYNNTRLLLRICCLTPRILSSSYVGWCCSTLATRALKYFSATRLWIVSHTSNQSFTLRKYSLRMSTFVIIAPTSMIPRSSSTRVLRRRTVLTRLYVLHICK